MGARDNIVKNPLSMRSISLKEKSLSVAQKKKSKRQEPPIRNSFSFNRRSHSSSSTVSNKIGGSFSFLLADQLTVNMKMSSKAFSIMKRKKKKDSWSSMMSRDIDLRSLDHLLFLFSIENEFLSPKWKKEESKNEIVMSDRSCSLERERSDKFHLLSLSFTIKEKGLWADKII